MNLPKLRAAIASRIPSHKARHEGTKALEHLLRDLTIQELRKTVKRKKRKAA